MLLRKLPTPAIGLNLHSKRRFLKIQHANIKGDKMPIPHFPDPKNAQEIYNFVIKALHLDRILVGVAIYHTNEKDWKIVIYKDKNKVIELLNRRFRLKKKRENPDTNKKSKVKKSELFLLLREKDGGIKLSGPVDPKADTSKNRKQKAESLGFRLSKRLKEGLGFLGVLDSFFRYDMKVYIFIFFSIKRDIIEKGDQELGEVLEEYLSSKELKSYIKQMTGMEEQKFEKKLSTGIFNIR